MGFEIKDDGNISKEKKPIMKQKIGEGITSSVMIILGLIVVGMLSIATIIIQLALAFIFTVYVITFGYGLFIDFTLFETQSIFTIPFNQVVYYGTLNPWLFVIVFVLMIIRKTLQSRDNKKKQCKFN